jgi:hypothetical protein
MVLDPLTAIIDPRLSPLAAICLPSPIIGSLDIAFGEIGDEPASYHGRADTFSEPNQSKAKGSCHPPLFATTGHLVQFQTARIIIIASQQDRASDLSCCAHDENCCHTPRKRGIQYAAASRLIPGVSGILDRPVKPGDDGKRGAVAPRIQISNSEARTPSHSRDTFAPE